MNISGARVNANSTVKRREEENEWGWDYKETSGRYELIFELTVSSLRPNRDRRMYILQSADQARHNAYRDESN